MTWTDFEVVAAHWKENEQFKRFLPAAIVLRVDTDKPLCYTYKLRGRAVFWVKPGSKPGTFKWGIR